MLTQERRRDLLLLLGALALYGVNQQVKTRVSWPAAEYLLRCHMNDYLGGIAFAAYLNLILSVSRWPEKRLNRPWQFLVVGVLCGLFWECAAPLFLPHSVGGPMGCGGLCAGDADLWGPAGAAASCPLHLGAPADCRGIFSRVLTGATQNCAIGGGRNRLCRVC